MKRVIARLAPAARTLALLVAIFAAAPSISRAASPLPPGGSLDKPGTTPALFAPYYTAGPVPANYSNLVASTAFPYNFIGTSTGAFLGSVLSRVLMDPIYGALAFSYRFNNLNAVAATDIIRMSIDDPTHPWTGVGVLDAGADGTGVSTPQGPGPFWANGDPYLIERDALFSGPDVQLRVGGRGTELLSTSNDFTSTIWLATDAKRFGLTNVGLLDGGNTGSALAYAPAVPEPGSVFLLTIGSAIGLLSFRRRGR